jgi:mono/diheme cytochrome c family protein
MARRNTFADADNSLRGLTFLFRLIFVCVPLAVSGCALFDDRGISVEPDPGGFGREYPEDFVAAGRKIAQEQCASCHAIDQQQRSRYPGAPPFNTLLQHRDPEWLTDSFIAGNRVGHDGMPRFDFNVIAADSLVAYLEAISLGGNERTDVRP